MDMYEQLAKLNHKTAASILAGATILFFSVTNPAKLPPIMLMIGFGLLLGTLYCVVRVTLAVVGLEKRLRPRTYSTVVFGLTVVPVLLLALQSLGQLTVRDGITFLLLLVIGFFYISRTTS